MSTTSPTPVPALLPLGQVARLLHLPSAWLRAEAEAGRLPCLRAGKAILMELETIEAILIERSRQSLPRQEDRNDG
jgi:hypothetical protein